jgi:hypothetical protein
VKKVIALVLSLMLLVAFTLGCKPAETPKTEAPAPVAEEAAPAGEMAPTGEMAPAAEEAAPTPEKAH